MTSKYDFWEVIFLNQNMISRSIFDKKIKNKSFQFLFENRPWNRVLVQKKLRSQKSYLGVIKTSPWDFKAKKWF